MMVDIIDSVKAFVQEKSKENDAAHDWWHIERVHNLAKKIAQEERGDPLVIELAALLHDVSDWKFDYDHSAEAKRLLADGGLDGKNIDHIFSIIDNISFKGGSNLKKMQSIEGKIVQDADRLDAMGAIGIARTFAFGGHKRRDLHNPNKKPNLRMTFEEYKRYEGTTINHFYEKLLLLKDLMNTQTGKRIAQERHSFMEIFLEEFFAEWEGSR